MSAAEDTVVHDETLHGCQVTTVEVRTKQAAAQLGRAARSLSSLSYFLSLLCTNFTPHFCRQIAKPVNFD